MRILFHQNFNPAAVKHLDFGHLFKGLLCDIFDSRPFDSGLHADEVKQIFLGNHVTFTAVSFGALDAVPAFPCLLHPSFDIDTLPEHWFPAFAAKNSAIEPVGAILPSHLPAGA